MAEIHLKCCSRCKQELPLTAFNRRRSRPDGLNCWCRECYREQHAAHNREWARKNTGKNYAKVAKWRKANPGRKHGCPERNRARARAWGKANPLRKRLNQLRRDARKVSLPYSWSPSLVRFAISHWRNQCAVCSTPLGLIAPLHWDHWIPMSSENCPGTVPGNMLPLCAACNIEKSDRDAAAWLALKFSRAVASRVLLRINRYFSQFPQEKYHVVRIEADPSRQQGNGGTSQRVREEVAGIPREPGARVKGQGQGR